MKKWRGKAWSISPVCIFPGKQLEGLGMAMLGSDKLLLHVQFCMCQYC